MKEFYDFLETRDPAEREAGLFARLPGVLRAAIVAPTYAERLRGIDPTAITDRSSPLSSVPALCQERA